MRPSDSFAIRRKRPPWLPLFLCAFAPLTAVHADDGQRVNQWITKHANVVYGEVDPKAQRFDAYLVQSGKPTPVLIEIHGGGFRSGNKSAGAGKHERFFDQNWIYMRALREGISVISIDYRLAPKFPFPAQGEDIARVVQFIRSKAKEWNLDPTRIASCGSSAGGHLSSWIGYHDDLADPESDDPIKRRSTRITAVVNISGPVDFGRFDPVEMDKSRRGMSRTVTNFVGVSAEDYNKTPESREKVRRASPIHLVSRGDPPTMLVYLHRGGKPTGPVPNRIAHGHSAWFGVLLERALSKNEVPVETYITDPKQRSGQADAIIAFLTKQLGTDGAKRLPKEATQNLGDGKKTDSRNDRSNRNQRRLQQYDTDGDGKISRDERAAAREKRGKGRKNRSRGTEEP